MHIAHQLIYQVNNLPGKVTMLATLVAALPIVCSPSPVLVSPRHPPGPGIPENTSPSLTKQLDTYFKPTTKTLTTGHTDTHLMHIDHLL